MQVNGAAALSLALTETDTSATLQFFGIRVANACRDVSYPEYRRGSLRCGLKAATHAAS